MEKLEAESDVEPQGRPRSCTWPPLPESSDLPLPPPGLDPGQMRKAKSSRRNAWGNLSYADLITKAIESSPERRLTLSQIYDWMVRFVPYFKDKGDSNSSAGWKNSIRHNLSLHTRFIRVQNEGTGKSSWWMLNPEGGKTGKTPRRRAASMDSTSGKFLRIKGKAGKKKQQQQVQTAPEPTVEGSPSSQHAKWSESPSSHTSDDFDVWAEFHSRANPVAPNMSGRLSPILGNDEPDDLDDDDVTPSSPLMYPSPSSALSPNARCSVEMPRLTELSGTVSMGEGLSDHLLDELQDGYSVNAALRQRNPGFSFTTKCPTLSSSSNAFCGTVYSQPAMGMMRRLPMQTIQENKQAAFSPGSTYRNSSLQDLLTAMSYGHKEGVVQSEPGLSTMLGPQRNHRQNTGMLNNCDSGQVPYSASLIKSHNLYHPPTLNHHCSVNNSALASSSGLINSESCGLSSVPHHSYFSSQGGHGSLLEGPYQGTYHHHHHHHHHHPQVYNQDRFPTDLDLDMFNGTLECDVESIILNDFMDNDEMDFNFDSSLPPQGGFNMAATAQPANQSWVQG